MKVGVSNNATCDDLSTKWFESDKQANRARQNSLVALLVIFGKAISKCNFHNWHQLFYYLSGVASAN